MPFTALHLYIADQLKGIIFKKGISKKHYYKYLSGSILPDIEHLMLGEARKYSHKKRNKMIQAFEKIGMHYAAMGMKVHFATDDYFHGGYVSKEAKKIGKKFHITKHIAHFLIEMSMEKGTIEKYPVIANLYDELAEKILPTEFDPTLKDVFYSEEYHLESVIRDSLKIGKLSYRPFREFPRVKKIIEKYPLFVLAKGYGRLKTFFLLLRVYMEIKSDFDKVLQDALKHISQKFSGPGNKRS